MNPNIGYGIRPSVGSQSKNGSQFKLGSRNNPEKWKEGQQPRQRSEKRNWGPERQFEKESQKIRGEGNIFRLSGCCH